MTAAYARYAALGSERLLQGRKNGFPSTATSQIARRPSSCSVRELQSLAEGFT